MQHFETALHYRQEQGLAKPIHIARWCIGRTLRSQGKISEAMALQRSLLAEYESGDEPGYTYEEIGECLHALGQHEEARPYFAQAYAVLSKDMWLVRDEPERLARLQALSKAPPE